MKITKKAPAKINLTLEVIGKQENDYHLLRTVILRFNNVFDEIEIEFSENSSKILVSSDFENLPENEDNICFKAVQKFLEKAKKSVGVKIFIKKKIPVSAGLGGGSSDAATVLLSMNEYFNNIFSENELVEIASEVGTDVPLFLFKENLTYWEGTGTTLIKKMNFKSDKTFLIVNPQVEIPTIWAYKNLANLLWFMRENRVDFSEKMIRFLNDGQNWEKYLYNDFELLVEKKTHLVGEIKFSMKTFGAGGVLMSGSGSTIFGVFDEKETANFALEKIKKHYPDFYCNLG